MIEGIERTSGTTGTVEEIEPAAEGEGSPPATRRRRRRRSGRGGAGAATAESESRGQRTEAGEAPESDAAGEGAGPEAGPSAGAPETGDAPVRRRRPRRRGGRGRSRSGTTRTETAEAGLLAAEDAEAVDESPAGGVAEEPAAIEATASEREGAGEEAPATGGRPRRRRRTRKPQAEPSGDAPATSSPDVETSAEKQAKVAAVATAPPPAESKARTRTRTRSRREPAPEPAVAEPGAIPEPQGPERPTRRRGRGFVRRRREAAPVIRRAGDKTMLITEVGERDQIAVLEDRVLVEHFITRVGARSMVGNIYLSKVQNVLPGMEAAFLDIGKGRNAVLYAGEVSYDEEIEGQAPRIEQVLKPGQKVLVQVTKDPIGGKGARLTQEISLPGRYVVLVPRSQVFGVSRRLPDVERGRLKDILKKIKPAEHGLIVRTAAEGAPAEDLQADLERLTESWAGIEKSSKRGKAPRLLYEEPELTVRVIRDHVTETEFREIVTDSRDLHERIVSYLRGVAPDLVEKVRMYEGPLPMMEAHHATEQIYKALDRKVWLPSGGYVVIDKTEAMTVIDVNTGKHVGKANLEETVTKTNIEAAEEIARQLRLRDIGGIIIIDFIDMLYERNREKVIQTLRNALAQDKTRSQVFDISPLGLLEVTRKRVSAGLLEAFSETCPTCEGRGILLTHKM